MGACSSSHQSVPNSPRPVSPEQASASGHLNTILTFYEITDPPVESPLSGLPIPLLRKAIAALSKTGRAQIISISDGEGVRFFPGSGK